MKQSAILYKLLLATSLAGVLAACGNNDSSSGASTGATGFAATSTSTTLSANAYTPTAASTASTTASAQSSPMKARDLSAAPTATAVNLGTPVAAQAAAAQKSSSNFKAGKPLQVGFSRQVAQTGTIAATQAVLKWQATPAGGKAAAISFTSSGAKGTRIGLLVTQLPETATLRFYAKGAAQAYEFSGKEVQTVLAKNLAAGDKTDAGRTFWGPVIEGVEGTVEVELPAGVSADGVQVAVPSLVHQFLSQSEAGNTIKSQNLVTNIGTVLISPEDVSCLPSLPLASDSIAMLSFVDNGVMSICSATLLNDNINSQTPFVMTANSCISSQTVASSLESRWKYRSSSCNSAMSSYYPGPNSATLLSTDIETDSTLLRLNGVMPSGLMFSGWDASERFVTNPYEKVTSIGHLNFDPQSISKGEFTGLRVRDLHWPHAYTLPSYDTATIIYTTQMFEDDSVVAGALGSGLFMNSDTNPQFIGQLSYSNNSFFGGPDSERFYGRFSTAFENGMSDWLWQGNKPVWRFFNYDSGTHFYTVSVTEAIYVLMNFPQFGFEGASFTASTITTAGLNPVYRFYNLALGVHFYTINAVERAWVKANLPQMRDEGIAWYAQPTAGGGAIPLFRFYNRDLGVHFYTVSTTERDWVLANLPQMNDEGIAYYVLP